MLVEGPGRAARPTVGGDVVPGHEAAVDGDGVDDVVGHHRPRPPPGRRGGGLRATDRSPGRRWRRRRIPARCRRSRRSRRRRGPLRRWRRPGAGTAPRGGAGRSGATRGCRPVASRRTPRSSAPHRHRRARRARRRRWPARRRPRPARCAGVGHGGRGGRRGRGRRRDRGAGGGAGGGAAELGAELVFEVGHVGPSRSDRRRASPREVWDFTVPRRMPRASAVAASLRSS